MSKFLAVAPVLLVRDVAAAADYYRDQLGFSYDRLWGEPPNFCMVQRDGLTVMLGEMGSGATATPNWKVVDKMWDAYIWVDDVEAD